MLDDGQAEAGAAGGPGAGRVDAVEALEDPLRSFSEMPMPWSVTAISTRPRRRGDPAGGDADAGAGRAVVDGVLDEVAERGGELAAVAPDAQLGGAAGGHRDLLGAGRLPAAVDRLGDQFVDPDRLGVLQRVVVLHPGEVDELLDEVGRAGSPRSASGRRSAHRLGVVARRPCTASESRESAPTGVLSSWLTLATKSRRTASMRRASVRSSTQQQHEPGAERGDPGGDRERLAAAGAAPGQVQFDLRVSRRPGGCRGPSAASARRRACRRGPVRGRTRRSWP